VIQPVYKGGFNMKIHIIILFICLFCSISHAEYKELEALKESSLEAVAGYAKRLAVEDPKFQGIVKFAEAVKPIDGETKVDIAKLTYKNKDYWRAVLEMTPKDSSILFTHAHLHASCGQTSYADVYFLLGSLTDAKSHQEEFNKYKLLRNNLNKRASLEISQGVKLHDKRQYAKAIEVYDNVINDYPSCAIAYYEKGLSYMMMSKMAKNDPDLKDKALQMYAQCRLRDPFFWKAYQGGDQNVIAKLQVCLKMVVPFVSGKRNKDSFIAFAEGCEEMKLYPFAAHARWKLSLIDMDNMQEHIKKFLDMIEKSGCKEADLLRKQFKFNDTN
jgi:tetratricopeptide (TPR) repeat protein